MHDKTLKDIVDTSLSADARDDTPSYDIEKQKLQCLFYYDDANMIQNGHPANTFSQVYLRQLEDVSQDQELLKCPR